MPEPLPPEFLEGLRLTADRRGVFGEPALFHPSIGSTNDAAARLAEAGAREGTLVLALAQTAGRGRLGRQWYSPPGAGLYASVVCRDAVVAPYLTLAGGVAVAEGIRTATGLPVEIKWPNDIVAPAAGRRVPPPKLAGILAEASSGPGGVQYVVLGFGINMLPAAYPPGIAGRASSIEAELGRPADPGIVLGETLASLAGACRAIAQRRVGDLLDRWRALAPSVTGSAVEWESPHGVRAGTAAGVDDTGALLVRTAGGVERVISGEVRWI